MLGPMAEPGRPKPSKKGLPKRSYTPELKDEAKRRLRAGEGVHQVAEDMGVNVRTVAKFQIFREAKKCNTKSSR